MLTIFVSILQVIAFSFQDRFIKPLSSKALGKVETIIQKT